MWFEEDELPDKKLSTPRKLHQLRYEGTIESLDDTQKIKGGNTFREDRVAVPNYVRPLSKMYVKSDLTTVL